MLAGARYPARNLDQNIGDLKAQVAANATGVAELRKMCAQFGLDVVQAYMAHVQDNARAAISRAISAPPRTATSATNSTTAPPWR